MPGVKGVGAGSITTHWCYACTGASMHGVHAMTWSATPDSHTCHGREHNPTCDHRTSPHSPPRARTLTLTHLSAGDMGHATEADVGQRRRWRGAQALQLLQGNQHVAIQAAGLP